MNQSQAEVLADFEFLQRKCAELSSLGLPVEPTYGHGVISLTTSLAPEGVISFDTITQARIFLLGAQHAHRLLSADKQASDAIASARNTMSATPGTPPGTPPDVTVTAYALEADSPVAEAVSNLLAAVVNPAASKGDRLRAAGEVLNAVNSL